MREETRRDQLHRYLTRFQDCSITLATGGKASYEDWELARDELMSQHELLSLVPKWIAANRWGGQYWQFIKATSETYAGRRAFIWGELAPLFDFIEKGFTQPTSLSLEPYLARSSSGAIAEAWSRIQARREADPEGAITLARTLLEGTCKELLHKLGKPYSDRDDLPKLYRAVADAMSLSPESHNEQIFKQILGGCMNVANGLASLRNTFGDAHGKSPNTPRPSPRHADLAINLAGTLSTFLMATYEDRFRPPGA